MGWDYQSLGQFLILNKGFFYAYKKSLIQLGINLKFIETMENIKGQFFLCKRESSLFIVG